MKVVKVTPSDCNEPVVVISHYQNVVSPVASISLPFGSDVHYFVFTVLGFGCEPYPTLVSLARRSRREGTSGDCSLLSVCKRNFINRVIDMLSRDKCDIITQSRVCM